MFIFAIPFLLYLIGIFYLFIPFFIFKYYKGKVVLTWILVIIYFVLLNIFFLFLDFFHRNNYYNKFSW
jgi:hypothetical protein